MLRRYPGRFGRMTPPGGSSGIPHHGRLTYVSATAIKFAPFNGDLIKINGALYSIPSGGIAGVANTSVFVNGTGGQNLAASTLYYVYAFLNSGVVTADFSTTAHATSATAGNVGVEIKSGDDTRTLIGMVFTNASSQFALSDSHIGVLSWFNRRAIAGKAAFTASRTTTSTTYVELNTEIRITFLTWADEAVGVGMGGRCANDVAGGEVWTSTAFDGTTAEDVMADGQSYTGGGNVAIGYGFNKAGLAVGNHYVTLVGKVSANTGTWIGNATAGTRTAHSVMVRG